MEKELINKLQKVFQTILEKTQKNGKTFETELDPIKICMIAPRRTGKTSIITTLFEFIKTKINNSKYEIYIEEDSSKTIEKFSDTIDTIHSAKKVGDDVSEYINTPPSGEIKRFTFKLKFKTTYTKDQDNQSVIVPFEIMDMPGGLINLDNYSKNQDPQYLEYAKHRDNSSIMLLPIDTLLLLERPITEDINERDAFIQSSLSINKITEEVCKWADNRAQDPHPCVIFIGVKCETYYSQSFNNQLAEDCFKEFRNKYDSAIDNILYKSSISLEMSFVPLETIGCIRKNVSFFDKLENENDKRIIHSFNKSSDRFEYLGAGVILATIFKRAFKQVEDTYGDANKYIEYIENLGFFKKYIFKIFSALKVKNNKGFVKNFYNALRDMNEELSHLYENDSCYKNKYNKVIVGNSVES